MKSVSELNDIIEGSAEIRTKVAAELSSGWPIPHITDGAKRAVSVFYYAMNLPPPHETFKLYPPSWLVVLDADSGKLLKIEKKLPIYYGLDAPPGTAFSSFKYDHPFEGAELDRMVRVFCANYTQVLTLWYAGDKNIPKEILVSFRRDFHWFVPSPTHRFYSHLHPQFAEICGI